MSGFLSPPPPGWSTSFIAFRSTVRPAFPSRAAPLLSRRTTPSRIQAVAPALSTALSPALSLSLSAATPITLTTVLIGAATVGLLSERTAIGRALTPPLVTTLLTLALANLTPLPTSHSLYTSVNTFLVPLAVPLLLFGADIRRVVRSTPRLFLAFLIGSVATVLGTFVAWWLLPLQSVLGTEAWKIAAALCARHIGGAVNYVAVAQATDANAQVVTSALAADNVVVALYFLILLALARNVLQPSNNTNPHPDANVVDDESASDASLKLNDLATSLTIAATLCTFGTLIDLVIPITLGPIPIITLLTLVLVTVFPSFFARFRTPASALGVFFMQIFFASAGAGGSLISVLRNAPILLVFSALQLAVHLIFFLSAGKVLQLHRAHVLVASNANVGGPGTAAAMAAAKNWDRLVAPSVLIGVFGLSVATFVGLGVGFTLR